MIVKNNIDNHALAILAEQTSQAYAALNNAMIATFINASILVAVLWGSIDHEILLIWSVVILLYCLLRVFTAYQYKKAVLPDENIELWSRRFIIGSLLGAAIWGAGSVWLFSEDSFAHQVFLTFVVGGLVAGAVTSLSYFKIAVYSFLVITLTPLIILFFMSQAEMGLAIGSMLMIFLVMMISTANRNHNNIKQSICLSIDNIEQQRFLQHSEQRYKTLLETATDAFFLHDTDGRFLDVNQQACRDLGYTREELLNMSVPDIEMSADPETLNQLWRKLEKDGNARIEGLHRRKDGTTFPVEVSVRRVQIDNAMLFSVLARDITTRKQSEAEIIAAKHEAERANQAKSEFLSRMS
ncbi:MAG: PAS domain S-box protein, partial [Gammaproteobacteria bacterium]|nr:PAS domain S-box protein [Gammaproteobacteria bacterium]